MDGMIFDICRVLATLAGLVVAYYLIPILKAGMAKYWDDNLTDFVKSCVWAAQQTIKDNSTKKAYVLSQVGEWVRQKGINITDEQIEILIESAVHAMKTGTNR